VLKKRNSDPGGDVPRSSGFTPKLDGVYMLIQVGERRVAGIGLLEKRHDWRKSIAP
jgi:hypothetical protein